jgi:hypothetical protein
MRDGVISEVARVGKAHPVDDPSTTADKPATVGLIFASALIVVGALHMLLSAFL